MKAFLALALVVTCAAPGVAQVAAGPEVLLNSRADESFQFLAGVSCAATGSCAVVWTHCEPPECSPGDGILGRTFSPAGELGPETALRIDERPGTVDFSADGDGFALAWDRNRPEAPRAVLFRRLAPDLSARGPERTWQQKPEIFWFLGAARRAFGRFVVFWLSLELDHSDPNCSGCDEELYVTLLNEAGIPVVAQQRAHEQPYQHRVFPGGLASWEGDAGPGGFAVVFDRSPPPGSPERDVFLRRFTKGAEPIGDEIRVNSFVPGAQFAARVAARENGDLVVVWMSFDQDGELEGIYGQRFGADGTPVGPEFLVNELTRSAQRFPDVAFDPHGNFVVVWQDFELMDLGSVVALWDVKARLFRADGTPVAGEVLVNRRRHNEQTLPRVAMAPNGTFVVGWESYNQASSVGLLDNESVIDVVARRFSASPGEEVCVVAGARLLCDTGRTGGPPELEQNVLWLDLRDGGVPLAGDFDGDGREDLCRWRSGRFACDLDHEGGPLEGQASWGLPRDTPLLGDVDGDGRGDPCVRRKRWLLCDTARDGGEAEAKLELDRASGKPLLGDVDGDGRDDVCLVENGRWHCFLFGGGRFLVRFGRPGAAPLLGDVDGDRRADLCTLESRWLVCDTARNGGPAEVALQLDFPPGSSPLLANLDGL